jgi:queuine tRNA-ribosyltransferase
MEPLSFRVEKRLSHTPGRAGVLTTPHGVIETPAFVTVGTKATVKALSPEEVVSTGAQVVLANTYHLYLEPGSELVEKAGGLGKFMHWSGPTMTDSGGFQVFSLGADFNKRVGKVLSAGHNAREKEPEEELSRGRLAKIDEEGVTFTSHIDGSTHRFTPEHSIFVQQQIGADMIFAFDECTSPLASYEYQKEALRRTHAWAERSLSAHKKNKEASSRQGLFGVIQGGRFKDLREESARFTANLGFDGFGIGGSFDKDDILAAVGEVCVLLPEDKPRHLLGIGRPEDLFLGVAAGADLFDCVAPTRIARTGALETKEGRINISNARFRNDLGPIEKGCDCYTCQNFSRAYVAHLFRAKEMLGPRLATIHNVRFTVRLVENIRKAILGDYFESYKQDFLKAYRRESAS